MAATTRNSTLYLNQYVNKYPAQGTLVLGGRGYYIPFQHTVVSGETGGASAGVQDKVNLCVLPKDVMCVTLFIASEDIWASAAVNGTYQLGDSGVADRYLKATESYTTGANAGGPINTETLHPGLSFQGQNFVTTADTIVVLTWKVANPVVGKTLKGFFVVMPLA